MNGVAGLDHTVITICSQSSQFAVSAYYFDEGFQH